MRPEYNPNMSALAELPVDDKTEDGLATVFAERHAKDLKYVPAWRQWFVWDGTRWKRDDRLLPLHYARAICREAADGVNSDTARNKLASAKTASAVVSFSMSDPDIGEGPDAWDRNPDIFNAGLTVDLATGKSYVPRQDDRCTRTAPITPGGDCPTWLAFLDRVTGGDRELQSYLQRLAGYCLTGRTLEHVLFFLYGPGGNGKSVFTETLTGIWGDYHATASMDLLVASKFEKHETGLAHLRGARLATATETDQHHFWAEAKVKRLTGGDTVSARFMRGDFFEFKPTFKLLIAGNHRPRLRNVDEAMRRRIHMVPFTVNIPKDEQDQRLSEKLETEWPGILQWAIDGCMAWRERGLSPPQSVLAATEDYLQSEDTMAQWIEESLTDSEHAFELSSDLYDHFKKWCVAAGENDEMTQRAFSIELGKRGPTSHREAGTGKRGFKGMRLTRPTYE